MFEYLPKTKSIWLLHCIESHFGKVRLVRFFQNVIKTNRPLVTLRSTTVLEWNSYHFLGFAEQSQERLFT